MTPSDPPWPSPLGSYASRLHWARPAQPVDNPTTSPPPPGINLHPSSSVRTLYHSPRIFAQLHFPPQWENHHLLAQIPSHPTPPLNLPASFLLHACISAAGSSTCLFTSLPVVRICYFLSASNSFAWVSVQGFYALTCVGKRGALAIHFLALFPAPTVETVFSVTGYVWTLNLLSQTTLATVFSLTQATPWASSWHKSQITTHPPHPLNFINSSIMSFGDCHLYSNINKRRVSLTSYLGQKIWMLYNEHKRGSATLTSIATFFCHNSFPCNSCHYTA